MGKIGLAGLGGRIGSFFNTEGTEREEEGEVQQGGCSHRDRVGAAAADCAGGLSERTHLVNCA